MHTLSVILTNYNCANCVNKTIETIAQQSRLPDEFIILDDGSTDNSVDIITQYAETYSFIKFIKNEKNLGYIPAMQRAASYATGDYVYFAAAENYILPGFFEKAMNAFAKYTQAGLFCGDQFNNIAGTNEMIPYEMNWSDREVYLSPDELADINSGRNFPKSVVRRDAFVRAGGFITQLKWHSDWFFYHVIAYRNGLIYCPEKFLVETIHQQDEYRFEGMMDVQKEAEVIRNIIQVLKSPEYIDVLPYFSRSAALFPLSRSSVDSMMKTIDIKDVAVQLLMAHPLYVWNMEQATLRSEQTRRGSEQEIASILEKINILILNGSIKDASGLLDTMETAFGKIPQILELRHKIASINKVIALLRNERQHMTIERNVNAIVKDCDSMIDIGNADEAEKKINELIYQYPKLPDSYRLMAKLMVQKRNFERALESCKTWISLQPCNSEAKIFEGFILFNLKEYLAAEKTFLDVLILDESNLDALINLAELSMHFRHGSDALGYLHRAQQYYPDNKEISTLINSFKKELGMSV